jgi:hypothetical protein
LNGTDVTGGGPLCVLVPLASSASSRDAGDHDAGDVGAMPGLLDVPGLPGLPDVLEGPRVGVRGGEDLPWRLWLGGEPTVSRVPVRRLPARAPDGRALGVSDGGPSLGPHRAR